MANSAVFGEPVGDEMTVEEERFTLAFTFASVGSELVDKRDVVGGR